MDHPANSGAEPGERLRGAVRRIPVDPELRAKVHESVERTRRRQPFRRPLLWLLLALLPALLLWIEGPSRDLLQRAADQHAACAVAGIVSTQALDAPFFRQQVAGLLPAGCRLLNIHRCRLAGRWFTHVVLAQRAPRISLLINDLLTSDTLLAQWAVPAPRSHYLVSGQPLADKALFLVSDLSMDQHESLARALDPASLSVSLQASLPMRFVREIYYFAE